MADQNIDAFSDAEWDRIARVYPVPSDQSRVRIAIRGGEPVEFFDLAPGERRRAIVEGRALTIYRVPDPRRA